MKPLLILAFLAAVMLGSVRAQSPMTAEVLGASCMVTCEVLNGSGTLRRDLEKNEQCIGYLKGLAGAANWFNRGAEDIPLGQCPQKLLGNRTARGPSEDELLIQSCKFGQWMVSRPHLYPRPAALAALNWMQLTGCQ